MFFFVSDCYRALDDSQDTNDGQNSDDGFVFMCSDDSVSPPQSLKCPSDKEQESVDVASIDFGKSGHTAAVCSDIETQESCNDQQADLPDNASHDVGKSSKSCSTHSLQLATEDVSEAKTLHISSIKSDGCTSLSAVGAAIHQSPVKGDVSLVQTAQSARMADKQMKKTPPKQLAKGRVINTCRNICVAQLSTIVPGAVKLVLQYP